MPAGAVFSRYTGNIDCRRHSPSHSVGWLQHNTSSARSTFGGNVQHRCREVGLAACLTSFAHNRTALLVKTSTVRLITLRRNRTVCQKAEAKAGAVGAADSDLPRAVPKLSKGLSKRIVSSTILGCLGAVVILLGGWLYCLAACLVAYQATQEYFGFVTSQGISQGMKPPPPLVTAIISLSCIGFIVWMQLTNGRATAILAVTSLVVLSLQLLTVKKPRFAQLSSSVFGLFYCGYLPSFWVKLRLLSAPAVNSNVLHSWPVLFGGLTQCTVGLIATFMAVCCIVASDTGAFFFGKSFGKTQLTAISPKKTVEGAVGGLVCSICTSLLLWRVFAWPAQPAYAAVLGVIVFFSSLFGDLIESVMKREAGLKDAGNLIPGHGGFLDRFDSYLFTGAIVYSYVKFVMPFFGI